MSHEMRTPLHAVIGFGEMLTSADGQTIDAISRATPLDTVQIELGMMNRLTPAACAAQHSYRR